MFWSGNFIVVRELNFLLKEENVTLSQVLEADDILQECKADNKALMQFLTRPDILAELITLITEEPPGTVELSQQYRHASIACEVLTSPLSMLSDRLSMDTAQMNRLCDFINRDPPLNPLLASYFSKTVEMLLERSPKQDWYLYHIVCLRVLDFFKSRRDFLPNLLRHMSTSAIADTFKFFIRLDDLFNKIIMEWLEEHQFIESLIQIICGTYVAEHLPSAEEPEKGTRDSSEKHHNHQEEGDACNEEASADRENNTAAPAAERAAEGVRARVRARTAGAAAANAAALLCEVAGAGAGAAEGGAARSRTAAALAARLAAAGGVRALLRAVFTAAGAARAPALLHGARLLLALLSNYSALGSEGTSERSNVELAVASHLPLLHQALLHDPAHYVQEESAAPQTESGAVGSARIQAAALVAHLALSEGEELPNTMLTLGTPGVLVDMFFRYPDNNFLHAQLHALCRNALSNPVYRTQYARHLFLECDLLTRLMDAFEENENKQSSSPRSGYMGHATLILGCVTAALEADGADGAEGAEGELARLVAGAPALAQRWPAFRDTKLYPALQQFDTPLGGSYPSENTYEVDNITDTLAGNYDFNYAMATATMDEVGDDLTNDNEMEHPDGHADSAEFIAGGLGLDGDDVQMNAAKSNFLELASQRFGDDMWDEAPEGEGLGAPVALQEVLTDVSPWESTAGTSGGGGARAGEGWAQFEGLAGAPADPFAEGFHAQGFANYWPYEGDGGGSSGAAELSAGLRALSLGDKGTLGDARTVSLATNLLTAMSAMSPAAIANIVNANLDPLPLRTRPPPATDLAEPAGHTDDSTDEVAEVIKSPTEVADAPVGIADTPVRVSDSPAIADPPAEVPNSPVKLTDLVSLPSGPDALPVNVNELQNVPCALDIETSLPVDLNDSAVNQNLPSEVKNSLPAESDTPTSPREKTKDLNDARSELANDSTVRDQKSPSSNSPTKTTAPNDSQDTVLENTNKEVIETPLEVSETPLEVSETPLKVSETPLEVSETPLEVCQTPLQVSETPLEVNDTSER